MEHEMSAYGHWSLVLINSAVFVIFAFSFTKPRTDVDWRSLGGFSAFIVAMFAEMYGFPLTIYFIAGWLQTRYPGLDPFAHDSGHLWHTLLGLEGDAHFDVLHIAANLLILSGFVMLASAWRVLHAAQQQHRLATTGWYARMRHPQYVAFMLIMLGFLLMWPTALTLLMYPALIYMYVRLARREEGDARREFGAEYDRYAAAVPAFIPRLTGTGASVRH